MRRAWRCARWTASTAPRKAWCCTTRICASAAATASTPARSARRSSRRPEPSACAARWTSATKRAGRPPSEPVTSPRTNTPGRNKGARLMKPFAVWGRLFAVALALVLPPGSTSVAQQQGENQQERAQTQPYNNAPVWREVRSGKEEYTSIKGRETGVLIQTYGETWRQLKNAWITPIVGWLIAAVVVVIGAFYKWRGAIKVQGAPTGRLIERFTPLERYTHWVVGISFAILGITGLIMMVGKYVLLPVIGYALFAWLAQLSKHLHDFAGPVFV